MAAESSSSSIQPLNPFLCHPYLEHVRKKSLDTAHRKIQSTASKILTSDQLTTWKAHSDQLSALAVDLYAIGCLSEKAACRQALAVLGLLQTRSQQGYLSKKSNQELEATVEIDDSKTVSWIYLPSSSKNKLGKGSSGRVRRAIEVRAQRNEELFAGITHRVVAVKKFGTSQDSQETTQAKAEHEFQQLQRLVEVPYVIRPIHISSHYSLKYKYYKTNLIEEYANVGPLHYKFIKKMGDDKWTLMCQLFEAIASMHEKGLTHTDLSTSNIMLTKVIAPGATQPTLQIRLIDVGSARNIDRTDDTTHTTGRQQWYQPPEIFKNKGKTQGDLVKVDAWQLAIVIIEAFCNYNFDRSDPLIGIPPGMRKTSSEGLTPLAKNKKVPDSIKAIIHSMLIEDPKNRCSVIDARDSLQKAISK